MVEKVFCFLIHFSSSESFFSISGLCSGVPSEWIIVSDPCQEKKNWEMEIEPSLSFGFRERKSNEKEECFKFEEVIKYGPSPLLFCFKKYNFLF
jgi:hypothetical protein